MLYLLTWIEDAENFDAREERILGIFQEKDEAIEASELHFNEYVMEALTGASKTEVKEFYKYQLGADVISYYLYTMDFGLDGILEYEDLEMELTLLIEYSKNGKKL